MANRKPLPGSRSERTINLSNQMTNAARVQFPEVTVNVCTTNIPEESFYPTLTISGKTVNECAGVVKSLHPFGARIDDAIRIDEQPDRCVVMLAFPASRAYLL